jgi:hypothetical protein
LSVPWNRRISSQLFVVSSQLLGFVLGPLHFEILFEEHPTSFIQTCKAQSTKLKVQTIPKRRRTTDNGPLTTPQQPVHRKQTQLRRAVASNLARA